MSKRISELTDAGALTGDELIEASRLSSTAYTATTISFDPADNSLNDSAAQFIAEGFAEKASVRVTGAANGVNNLFTGRILTLTAGKMIIAAPEGDDIITEAAGASMTITLLESVRTPVQAVADLTGDASAVTYTPTILADWNGSADPGNADDAFDQLAERVKDLETATPTAPDASVVTYTPADATDWNGSADPGDVDQALDQLAARTAVLESIDPVAVFAGFYPGAPGADALMLVHPVVVTGTLRANLAGCRVEAETAATASTVLTLKRGGTTIGTATFAPAGTVATLATTGGTAQAVTAGSDKLYLIAPTTPDATLANISYSFLADR